MIVWRFNTFPLWLVDRAQVAYVQWVDEPFFLQLASALLVLKLVIYFPDSFLDVLILILILKHLGPNAF